MDIIYTTYLSFAIIGLNSLATIRWETLRSRHGTCVFYDKCCVRINECVFIVVKIKCMNLGKISDICDKVNFTTKLHIFYNIWQKFNKNTHNILSKHINITIFDTFGRMVLLWDLKISQDSGFWFLVGKTLDWIGTAAIEAFRMNPFRMGWESNGWWGAGVGLMGGGFQIIIF